MTILDQLAAHARERVASDMTYISFSEIQEEALALGPGRGAAFEEALRKPGLSLICEVKKASPSKGIISPDFPYLDIARSYEAAGADAISCLTEPRWFLGSDQVFRDIRTAVSVPMLRKDFTVDSYQIYQARVMGADAVLLICAILTPAELCWYLEICDILGLAALVETRNRSEINAALTAGARIIGVNNRDLRDFSVSLEHASTLRGCIPPDCVFVAESGIKGPEDAAFMRQIGADAVLVGESLMRAPDRRAMIRSMREGVSR